ncbi:DUF292-domain-containing protein [Cristinia sonorae]|uniref:DUF292-domain-containing protein n=1 Tax=Cristinia sonorae TaxID=1940300 RepID=A0A8K0XNZ9_9AGAR|nr:DUF292-domain-containing protein [Cristinia sonorae]
MVPWNSAKAKVQLRLGVQRLRTLQEKKNAQAKAARRDIASLLERGKLETARIKVENIINEDIYVELLELLELYCELLISRFALLDQSGREPDPGVLEGVVSIIFASPRTELKELHILRELLMHKFGREFSLGVIENRDGCVPARVSSKLVVETPPNELVDAYLREIAKGYGVPWTEREPESKGSDSGGDGDGGVKNSEKTPHPPVDAATISAEARSAGVRTPKLPEVPPTESEDKSSAPEKPAPPPGTLDDFDMLAARFAALKKK